MDESQKILIVDDSPKNLQLLGTILKGKGYRVMVAQNGQQALTICQTNIPNLILLDVMMPGMDGFETCQQLKSDSKTKDIPIIFLTAATEDEVKGFELGAVDYVTKPFNKAKLLARVSTHLQLVQANETIKHQQAQLLERERSGAIGETVGMVTHEVLNPMTAVLAKIRKLLGEDSGLGLIHLIISEWEKGIKESGVSQFLESLKEGPEEGDSPLVVEDVMNMQESMKETLNDIKVIEDNLHRMVGVIENMRKLIRSDTNIKLIDVKQVVENAEALLHHKLTQRQIEFIMDFQHSSPIPCDPSVLLLVLHNLVRNAIQAIGKNGFIRIWTVETEGRVEIHVQNSGQEIPSDIVPKIFEMGFSKEGGPGFGLGMGKRLLHQIFGDLELESPGGNDSGAVFLCWLPKHTVDESSEKKTEPSQAANDFPELAGIDTQEGLENWEDPERYRDNLLSFAQLSKTNMSDLRTAIGNNNFEEVCRISHALKGVAGNLSITNVLEISAALNTAAEQKSEDCAELLERLETVLNEVVIAIRTLEETSFEDDVDGQLADELDREKLGNELRQLFVDFGRSRSPRQLTTSVYDQLRGHIPPNDLERLTGAVNNFDFKTAQEEIKNLSDKFSLNLKLGERYD